ncbi:MAG: sulfatase activating formylglycine-generating enzyme [Verrucomicrobiales bacterium]|jgi:formylglycine-generating enzyme required for sulfatase activity
MKLPLLTASLGLVFGLASSRAQESIKPDGEELTGLIHAFIEERTLQIEESEMEPYKAVIPVSKAEFSMIPIPAGEFLQGSPEDEKDRRKNEGPQRKVHVEPFWMGKCEVSWDEFEPYIEAAAKAFGRTFAKEDPLHEIMSGPSEPTYTDMSFGMGRKGFPAISMTQHAALKYCQWLSAQTGHFYRLPTEAEWEYACRAGTTTAYSWGDDPKKADQYAWYFGNALDKYQKVGSKLPNPWGLHDMHGNLIEWTLDAYFEDAYTRPATEAASGISTYVKPGKNLYPRSTRGGS